VTFQLPVSSWHWLFKRIRILKKIWLAAVKVESEKWEYEWARKLLAKARQTPRVLKKSAMKIPRPIWSLDSTGNRIDCSIYLKTIII
jgi:hypothetical protein